MIRVLWRVAAIPVAAAASSVSERCLGHTMADNSLPYTVILITQPVATHLLLLLLHHEMLLLLMVMVELLNLLLTQMLLVYHL